MRAVGQAIGIILLGLGLGGLIALAAGPSQGLQGQASRLVARIEAASPASASWYPLLLRLRYPFDERTSSAVADSTASAASKPAATAVVTDLSGTAPAHTPMAATTLAPVAIASPASAIEISAEPSTRTSVAPLEVGMPITGIVVPRIGLATDVVTAPLVPVDGGQTWAPPAFKVGHAEGTPGAGGAGNTVLIGHVTSPDAGSVFQQLWRLTVGDEVGLSSLGRHFVYRVVEIRTVERTDVSVVASTDTPTATLITCTGAWLPQLRDFSHRLVVRAELAR
jgi:LPXTG-site transpeptidase (sortase) family protein